VEGVASYSLGTGLLGAILGGVLSRSILGALVVGVGFTLVTALALTVALGVFNAIAWTFEGLPWMKLCLLGAVCGVMARSCFTAQLGIESRESSAHLAIVGAIAFLMLGAAYRILLASFAGLRGERFPR